MGVCCCFLLKNHPPTACFLLWDLHVCSLFHLCPGTQVTTSQKPFQMLTSVDFLIGKTKDTAAVKTGLFFFTLLNQSFQMVLGTEKGR